MCQWGWGVNGGGASMRATREHMKGGVPRDKLIN